MDIAALLESHRKHTIEAVGDDQLDDFVARAHDRATTKTLLDLYRSGANGELKPRGEAAMTVPPPLPLSRAIKPGSKRAKDRARKAQATRQANLAAKAKAPAGEPALSPATALTPVAQDKGEGVA